MRTTWLCAVLGWSTAMAAPGEHIVLGDAVITPSVTGSGGYRSNPLRVEDDALDGAYVALSPRVDVGVDTDQTLVDVRGTFRLVDFQPDVLVRADRIDLHGSAELALFRDEVVGLELMNELDHRSTPVGRDNLVPEGQFYNHARANVRIQPAQSLTVRVGGGYRVDNYVVSHRNIDVRPFNYRDGYGVNASVTGELSTVTTVGLEGSVGMLRWGAGLMAPEVSGEEAVPVRDSEQVRVMARVHSEPASGWTVDVATGVDRLGYRAATGEPDATAVTQTTGVELWAFDAHLGYAVSDRHDLQLNVWRGNEDVWFSDYRHGNGLTLSYEGSVSERAAVHASVGVQSERFRGPVERVDAVARGDVMATWAASRVLDLGVGGRWRHRGSDSDTVLWGNAPRYDDVGAYAFFTATY